MFINCRHCNALVATDPVTDQPPERCPRCAGGLAAEPPAAAPSAATDDDAARTPEPPIAEDPRDVPPAAAEPVAALSSPEKDVEAGPAAAAPTEPSAPSSSADAATAPESDASPTPEAAEPTGGGDQADAALASTAATAPASPIAPPPRTAHHPSFVPAPPAPVHAPHARNWLLAGIAALSLLLVLQVLLADRARLAADAGWRPVVSSLCAVFGCTVPPWREPAAFSLLARDVRPDPSRPGLLHASATFRNDARWAQAWPEMVLTLSDVDGRAIGRRAFEPHEYLGAMPTQDTLASGQSAMVRLQIMEPAANVVSFSFELR